MKHILIAIIITLSSGSLLYAQEKPQQDSFRIYLLSLGMPVTNDGCKTVMPEVTAEFKEKYIIWTSKYKDQIDEGRKQVISSLNEKNNGQTISSYEETTRQEIEQNFLKLSDTQKLSQCMNNALTVIN